jgi:type I restriction enzyme S subunit
MGQAPLGESYNTSGEGFPLIAGAGDYGEVYPEPKKFTTSPTRLSQVGDIILCIRATIGDLNWSDKVYCLGRGVAALRPKGGLSYAPYIWHVVTSKKAELNRRGTGSTFKQISRDVIDELEIPLPPLPEQKRIAAILDRADAIRRKREKAIELTDSFLRSVFLEMFGNPESNPHGFEKGTIRDLVSEVKYGTSGKAGALGKYEILRMNNLTYSGDIDLSSMKRIDIEQKEEAKYLVRKGDLLFNRTNSKELVGKTAVYPFDTSRVIAGYLIRVRPNHRANIEYIGAYLNSEHGKKTLFHMCKSIIGMANINAQELQDIEILMPPVELQNKFALVVAKIRELKAKLKRSLQQSEDLSACLSNRLFEVGTVKVSCGAPLEEVAHAL